MQGQSRPALLPCPYWLLVLNQALYIHLSFQVQTRCKKLSAAFQADEPRKYLRSVIPLASTGERQHKTNPNNTTHQTSHQKHKRLWMTISIHTRHVDYTTKEHSNVSMRSIWQTFYTNTLIVKTNHSNIQKKRHWSVFHFKNTFHTHVYRWSFCSRKDDRKASN